MTLPFKNIPANIRVPLFYAELDNSMANTGQINQRTLIVGQITSSGLATANVPRISEGVGDAAIQGGANSMLAHMTEWYRKRDSFGEVWYLPLADDNGATAASGSVEFTHAATAAGTFYLYIGGVRYVLPVLTTQTINNLATALAALITADATCPVTAVVDNGNAAKVNFTAVNKGPCGNDIDIRANYLGARGGEVLPTGLTVTITAMSSGETAPTLTTAFSNLTDMPFDFIVFPYTDTTSLNALKTLLDDQTGRWSWGRKLYGHGFCAYKGTLGSQQSLGAGRNDQHAAIMGYNDSPTPSYLWAANMTGAAAVSLRADPGLPLHTLALDVLPPPVNSRFALTDRNTLLYTGISTYTVSDDGTVRIDALITTYQKNAFSNPDNSYLKVETMFLLAYVLRALETLVTSKYSRMKLAADGTRFAPGSAIVTPNIIRADLIAQYQQLEYDGFVQNTDAFKANLIVQKDSQNPNRVNVLYPGVLINQLDIFALLFQFRLQ